MKVMPVVHFNYFDYSTYLDPNNEAFKQNIFVAMQQIKRFENGTKAKEFYEFMPCSRVSE